MRGEGRNQERKK